MLRLLVVSDVHAATSSAKRLRNLGRDVTIIAGDLSYCGSIEELREVLDIFASHGPPVVWVPGNCDKPEAAGFEHQGTYNVHGRLVVIDGVEYAGVGGGLYSPFNTPFEMSDEAHEEILRNALSGHAEDRPLILVSHQPPYESGLDRVSGGLYVGAKGLRRILAEYQPLLLASGHIHESWGATSVEGVLAVNPGPLKDRRYALVDIDVERRAGRARLYKL